MTASVTIEDDIATITMDDGKANAISHTMLDALNAALDEAETGAKAVVLAGRDGLFCGGFDLKVMQGATGEEVAALVNRGGALAHRLYGLRLPLVAAVTGHGIAMGAFILMACDTRIGPQSGAKFGMNETAIGMVIPMFAQVLAEERLALRHRTAAFIQAKIYESEEAVAAGYLDSMVPAGEVLSAAKAHAAAMAAMPTGSYAGNKLQIRGPALERMKASLAE